MDYTKQNDSDLVLQYSRRLLQQRDADTTEHMKHIQFDRIILPPQNMINLRPISVTQLS